MIQRLLLAAVLFAFLLVGSPAWAGSLDGTWVFAGDQAELDGRERAVEAAAAEFPKVVRGIAAKRIGRSAITPGRYVIVDKGQTLVMQLDDGPARETDLVGTAITFTPSGRDDTATLKRERQGDAVHSTVVGETGSLESHLERVGEQLRVTLTVSSERLAQPVSYALTYRRE